MTDDARGEPIVLETTTRDAGDVETSDAGRAVRRGRAPGEPLARIRGPAVIGSRTGPPSSYVGPCASVVRTAPSPTEIEYLRVAANAGPSDARPAAAGLSTTVVADTA